MVTTIPSCEDILIELVKNLKRMDNLILDMGSKAIWHHINFSQTGGQFDFPINMIDLDTICTFKPDHMTQASIVKYLLWLPETYNYWQRVWQAIMELYTSGFPGTPSIPSWRFWTSQVYEAGYSTVIKDINSAISVQNLDGGTKAMNNLTYHLRHVDMLLQELPASDPTRRVRLSNEMQDTLMAAAEINQTRMGLIPDPLNGQTWAKITGGDSISTLKDNKSSHTPERKTPAKHSAADYTVACIFPMGVEFSAGIAMLDEKHDDLPQARDHNAYILGKIGQHSVVLATMPEAGESPAARVATQLANDFRSIRFGLLVGIGGGIPSRQHDIRLGDVVISKPVNQFGGVVQYNLGKVHQGQGFERTGMLNKPGPLLQGTVQKLSGLYDVHGSQIPSILEETFHRNPRMRSKFCFPTAKEDILFVANYLHSSENEPDCKSCDSTKIVSRTPRQTNEPELHFGTIGSANLVLRDAELRDELQRDMDLLCVEMEAAGLVDELPCLVIRGICDYADSHKNMDWQPYAATVAAACMKEILLHIPIKQVAEAPQARNMLDDH